MRFRLKKIVQTILILQSSFVFSQSGEAPATSSVTGTKRFENTSNSSLIGGFVAIPLGDFGKDDINNGGYAKQGYGFAFDSKNYIAKGFSFVFHSTYTWIDMDAEAMSKDFTEYLGLRTEVKDGQHQPFLSTIGVNYDYYFNERLKIGLNAQAGVLYNSFRPFSMNVYDASNTLVYSDIVSFESDFAFSYCFGTDLSFTLIPNVLSFQISADYSAGKLDTYLISRNTEPIKAIEKMQLFNLGAGLVFYSKK